jgi:fatty acid desaturase
MQTETRSTSIEWYRSPIKADELKKLYVRSDLKGLAQSLGYLGTLFATGGVSLYSFYHWHWWTTVALVFFHGMCCAFCINAVHETGHLTVFKTKWLNIAFVHIFAFLGLINHRMFETSHVRHHRSTLHPPDDLEVVVPIKTTLKDFLRFSFVNFNGPRYVFAFHFRVARGIFVGEWEDKLFPESNPERRLWASRWSKTILIGQSAIVVAALCTKLWLLPILITLSPFYGGWLFFLCNNTQHVGLQDNVSDFRLNTRTFTLNPIIRFLYWHMNYHTEHHMYVGVPCYNLGRLHRLIKDDLPPCPNGLTATWLEIHNILKKQAADPTYVHIASLPPFHSIVTSYVQN